MTQYPVCSSSSGILNKQWLSHLDLGQSVSLLLTTRCEIAQGWGRDTGFGVKGSGLESYLQASRSWGHHFIFLTLSILIHEIRTAKPTTRDLIVMVNGFCHYKDNRFIIIVMVIMWTYFQNPCPSRLASLTNSSKLWITQAPYESAQSFCHLILVILYILIGHPRNWMTSPLPAETVSYFRGP